MNLQVAWNLIRSQWRDDNQLASALEHILKALEELDKRLKALGG